MKKAKVTAFILSFMMLINCIPMQVFAVNTDSAETSAVEAPIVQVPNDLPALAATKAKAPAYVKQSIKISWEEIAGAKDYSLVLAKENGLGWTDVLSEEAISVCNYTLSAQLFVSTGIVYRLSVSANDEQTSETSQYYFKIIEQTKDTGLSVNDKTTVAWDISAAEKSVRSFVVESELSWTTEASADWITCVQVKNGLTVEVSENKGAARSGKVTVSNGENTATIQIRQGIAGGAPKLAYPFYSQDSEAPTVIPVGGMILSLDTLDANYVGIAVYEGTKATASNKVFEGLSTGKNYYQVLADVFEAETNYVIELSGYYSDAYQQQEEAADILTSKYYVRMVDAGHEILINGTDEVEETAFASFTAKLYSTGAWTWTSDADWMQPEDYEQVDYEKDYQHVKIQLEPNYTKQERTGTITFLCGKESATLTVTQKSWLPRIILPADISQDVDQPTILPYSGFVKYAIYQEATYATYENGTWSEETIWGSTTSEVTEWRTLFPDNFFSNNVLYRFTLKTGEHKTIYYVKFSDAKKEPYAVFYESFDHYTDLKWDVTAGGCESQVSLCTSGAWSLQSDASWLTVSSDSGSAAVNKKKVTLTAAENTTGAERVGTLTLSSNGGAQAKLRVVQAAQDYLFVLIRDEDNDYRAYDPIFSCKSEDGSGSTVYFNVWANGDHTVESKESWITCSEKKLVLAENDTGKARYGTVTITCGNTSQEITVGQVAKMETPVLVSPIISTDRKNPSVLEHGEMHLTWKAVDGAKRYRVQVRPNDSSLCVNSNFYSYVLELQDTGAATYSCDIPASAFTINGEDSDYIAIYAYDAWDYDVSTRFYLISAKGEAAIINGTTSPVWDNATDLEVSNTFIVKSTSTWTAETDTPWISVDNTSGTDGDSLTVTLSRNYGVARTGEVRVTVGGSTTVLTVRQCAYLTEFPTIISPELSNDRTAPTLVDGMLNEIRVTWNYEPQVAYYKVYLQAFKSDTVQTIEASSPKLHTGEYTFTDVSLVPGQRYCIQITRNSHWGYTGNSYYFTPSDENAFVLAEGKESLELELDGDEDYVAVDITSSGVWTASVSDSWILVDNERIQQADLDADGYTAAEFGTFSGKNGERLYISVLENPTNAFRYGTVTMRCAGAEMVIKVVQEPYYELARIQTPVLGERYKSAVGVPYGDLTLYWSQAVGGNGKYDLVLTECYEGTSKGEEVYTVKDVAVTYLTIPKRYLKEGYYYELRLDTQLDDDPDNNRCTWHYFYVQYANALSVTASANWDLVDGKGLVGINASAWGGSGEYLYTYELLHNGVQKHITPTEKLTYYSFPISEPGTYQVRVSAHDSSGATASVLSTKHVVEVPVSEIDRTPPQTVWDNSVQNIWIGDEFSFAGTISSQNKIDKVHVDVTRAGTTSSIDYYRVENYNSDTFDMTNIPSFIVGDVLKGLKVTNAQDSLSVYSGTYLITVWVTDYQGISNGGVTKTITVNALEEGTDILPNVVLQTAAAETTSSVKMQAKVTDLKDGIITQYGFNLYQNADDTTPIAVYNKASGVLYSTVDNTIIHTATGLDLASGLYAEAFAVYYQGEEERMGVSERLYVAPKSSAFTFTAPVNGQILGEDMLVNVSGWVRPVPMMVLIYLYDAEYNELSRHSAKLTMEGVFDTQFSMESYRDKPGKYYIQAVCNSLGNVISSQYVSIVVPGGIDIQVQPVATGSVGVNSAVVQASFQEYQDKNLTDYGIYLYENMNDTVPVARYSKSYKNGGTIQFHSNTGALTVTAAGLRASKQYYAEAFAVYSKGSTEIVSISENRQSFTTRAVSASISSPQNNTVVENNQILVSGTIRNRSETVNVTGVTVQLKTISGKVLSTHPATVSGNSFSASINTASVGAGSYLVQAQVASDDGYTAYTANRTVTISAPITGVGLYNCTESYYIPEGDQLTIARGYHAVIKVLAEPDVSAIKSIEWKISDPKGISITPWANNYNNSHPHTYQINALKAGVYTLTAVVHNYDGTSVSTTVTIKVNLLTVITVIDYYTLKPVESAMIAIQGYLKRFTTDQWGQVVLDDLTEDVEREIDVSYMSSSEVQDTMTIKAGESNIIFTYQGHQIQRVQLTERRKLENGSYEYDQTELLKQKVVLDYMDESTDLMITIQAQESVQQVEKYQIVQQGQAILSNTTGVFSWHKIRTFKEIGDIYARIIYKSGGVIEKKINLSFYRNPWDGTDGFSEGNIDFGSKLEIKFPADSPLAGQSMEVDLSNLPINIYSTSDDKLRVVVGFKEVFDARKEELKVDDDYLEMFAECKNFVSNVQAYGMKAANNYMQLKGHLITEIGNRASLMDQLDFEPNVFVWAEYDTKANTLSFAVAAELNVKFNKEYQMPFTFPLVLCVEAEVGADAELAFANKQMTDQVAANKLLKEIFDFIAGELKINFHFGGGIGGGVGYANIATVTANASFNLEGAVQFPTSYSSLILSSDGFLRAKLLSFEYNIPFYNRKWMLSEGTLLGEDLDGGLMLMSVYDTSLECFAPADRSYAEETTDWYEAAEEEDFTLMGAIDGQYDVDDVKTLMSSIYPDTQMQTVETEQDKVMVWLTDDITREANNRVKLVYSVFDNITGKWTVPQSVADDGTLDNSPRLATDGENIYAVWVNLNKAFTEDMALEDALLASEISVAVFDTNTKTFGKVQMLTNDNALDSNPSIGVQDGQAVVSWMKNSEGDAWGVSGTNTLYTTMYANGIWTNAEAVKSVTGLVSDVKAGYLDGAAYVAYGVDQDSDFKTVDDIQLYLLNVRTKDETELGNAGVNGALQYAVLKDEQVLAWSSDGEVKFVTDGSAEVQTLAQDLHGIGNFRLISNEQGAVVLQTVENEAGSELYVAVYHEQTDTWNGMIQLTYQEKGYINDYSAFLNAGSEIEVVFTCEKDGTANLYTSSLKPMENISLDQFAIDGNEALEDKSVIGFATVTNHGLSTIEEIVFTVSNNGKTLSESVVATEIKAGETTVVNVPIQVPKTAGVKTFKVTAEVNAVEETTEEDNVAAFKLGYTDLALSYQEFLGEGARMLEFTVTNESGYASGATINLYENNKNGAHLGTLRIERVDGKAYVVQSMVLEAADKVVYAEVVADGAETDLTDNSILYQMTKDEIPAPVVSIKAITNDRVQLHLDNDKAGICVVAVYGENEKMLTCGTREVPVEAGDITVTYPTFSEDASYTVRIFIVDQTYAPLYDCVTQEF